MSPTNLPTLLKNAALRQPNKKGIFYKQEGRYVSYAWKQFYDLSNRVALGLKAKGLKSDEKIAILSENRPEWALTDLAALSIGAVSVPVYTSLTSVEIQYILKDSQCAALAVSNKTFLEKIIPIQSELPDLRFILLFDSSLALLQSNFTIPLIPIKDLERLPGDVTEITAQADSILPDKTATIIYTSGTTGPPKGVMLSHRNFISNVLMSERAINMSSADSHLSFLPLSHVFERMAGYYLMIHVAGSIAYAENMDTVSQNMLEIKPTYLLGVPRFYEKIKDRVLEAVQNASSARKGLFFWAKSLGEKRRTVIDSKKKLGVLFWLEYQLANILVYKKFRKRLGGRVRFCVSGGAPLSKEVAEFFYDLGVLILEGYGLTETSPVIAFNREDRWKFGTVGPLFDGIQVKFTPEGELATKSDCVMQGYWNKKTETDSVLKDGWFYTGDLGVLDKNGFLTITGRKKELIVTSGGKKISPRFVEETVEKNPYILRCVLFGEGRNYITALIVPDKERVLEYAHGQKIAFNSYAELLKSDVIYKFLENQIEEASKELANFEKIKYFVPIENDFTQISGELTPTLKVKRDVVLSRHKETLLSLYKNRA